MTAGTAWRLGVSGRHHYLQARSVIWTECLLETGTERSIVDRAANLKKIGTPSRPTHLLLFLHHMASVVLHPANAATASATGPPNSVISGLCGNDFLLKACQQQLLLGQGQTQTGDIAEGVGPVDRHGVGGLFHTVRPDFHQPYNPRHAPPPGQKPDAKISLRRSHPNLQAV